MGGGSGGRSTAATIALCTDALDSEGVAQASCAGLQPGFQQPTAESLAKLFEAQMECTHRNAKTLRNEGWRQSGIMEVFAAINAQGVKLNFRRQTIRDGELKRLRRSV